MSGISCELFGTVIHSTDPSGTSESLAERERAGVHHLLDRGITGMIFLSGEAPDVTGSHEHFAQLSELGARMVLVNAPNDALNIPCVGVDERAAGVLAAEHLVSLGHERIGIIGGAESFLHVRQRLQGVQATLERHGVMRAAADAGLRLPRDLSIVGFDGAEACEYSLPRLTTIAQPINEIARASVRILAELLADQSRNSQSVLFRPRLIERESTAPRGARRRTR